MSDHASDLDTRYGTPTRGRTAVVVVAVVLSALGLGWLAWATMLNISPDVTSKLMGYHIDSDRQITVRLFVQRADTDTPATCRLQALAADHSVAGEVTVPVTSGPTEQTVDVVIRTVQRASAVNRIGCTTPDQARPR